MLQNYFADIFTCANCPYNLGTWAKDFADFFVPFRQKYISSIYENISIYCRSGLEKNGN